MHKFFNAAKTGDVLHLSIYGSIGASYFDEGITAQTVSDALKAECKSVTVHVNSPGGNAFDGVAIYNLLKATAKPVNVVVEGMAASAASILAMAGDTITMATGSVLMIHEAMSMSFGNADAMRKMADTLTTVTSGIADIYVAKTALPKADILAMQNVETWMSADEAVAKGFATSVSTDQAVKNEFKLDAFSNVPTSLTVKAEAPVTPVVAATCGCDCAECVDGDCSACSNPDCTDEICNCDQTTNKAKVEEVRNVLSDLSRYRHQLEINKRR